MAQQNYVSDLSKCENSLKLSTCVYTLVVEFLIQNYLREGLHWMGLFTRLGNAEDKCLNSVVFLCRFVCLCVSSFFEC